MVIGAGTAHHGATSAQTYTAHHWSKRLLMETANELLRPTPDGGSSRLAHDMHA
jgi:fructoselysine-6-P-deglycase FrlB-like protein